MRKSGARTVTDSGNVIYQRTQRGWINSLGLWPLLLPVGVVLVISTWPPESPYLDTLIYGLFTLLCLWRVFDASRTMVVALGDKLMQYVGMGGPWELIYRDLARVDVVDEISAFALRTTLRPKREKDLPRYLVLADRQDRERHINLTWFKGSALLCDLEERLPEKVERSERYREALELAELVE